MDDAANITSFEVGFEDFPRQLPENCVEYILLIIDSQLESRKLLSALDGVRKAAAQLTERLTKDYIWQRDALSLELKNDKGLLYLHGTSYYGDAVEDEWLIVYLLRELTKSFPNLWLRVFDSDGEFLLVEAANVLPSWLSPEIDRNRVWIHRGRLYIIPMESALQDKNPLSLPEAISRLKSKPAAALVHSSFIEAEAFYRLEKYPGQIHDSLHYSVVTVPRKLAYILHQKPAAIAPAVEAFYLRDPVSMKSLFSPFGKPTFPPPDLVTVSVKFTKVLFAQLKSQHFAEPPAWKAVLEGAETSTKTPQDSQKDLDRLRVGMKLTSGFEMLATNAETKDNRITREVAILLEDLDEDGAQALPKDTEIQSWPNVDRDDDESWMDINYDDFEKELDGRRGPRASRAAGFGSSSAQADLQKIVSRFESFLNDDKAGFEGAELDDMDFDDDLSDEDEGSEDEDKAISFDEEQFARMMREMMGMPADGQSAPNDLTAEQASKKAEEPLEEADEDEDEAIRQLAAQMETELNEHGALRLEPTRTKVKALRPTEERKGKGKENQTISEDDDADDDETESDSGELNIDYNLAKNLLESFKGQAGMAGPAGNILGMMGMKLPRDEGEKGGE